MHILVVGGYTEIHERLHQYGARITHFTEKEMLNVSCKIYYRQIGFNSNESHDNFIKIASAINEIDKIDIVISFTDYFQILACEIAEKLGLKYFNSKELLINMKNKYKMRGVLQRNKINSLKFQIIDTFNITNNNEKIEISYPYICKPIDQSGSNFIFLIKNPQDFVKFVEFTNKKECPDKFLIEEYYDGKEYSVESFSIEGKHYILGITEKFKDKNFVEIGHCMPAELEDYERYSIVDYVVSVLTALGMNSGPSHTEIIVGNRGPIIIESHARLGGDSIPILLSHVSNIKLFDLWARLAIGYNLENYITPIYNNNFVAIWFKTAKDNGILTYKIDHINSLKILEYKIYKENNEFVEKTINSNSRIGHFIAMGNSREDAINSAKTIEDEIKIV
ncbi:ATP-grasp domain-containing protein [Sedimentibacter hydroxybenzoicus DSM 7310]|uniref:ATP-grasp domain-containing protein n=1 Tax=Sedimentibacter hydroxybenzoicus DSM 7310 TaxID=1123245 RepID=A0A974GUX9_SEDHY|nr:ATP-grasp domain-containing protein [Sedimentibacter hydroxybenzoicus]NYB72803.1 ATP-grasp domain-containing protein [Sedimentibacter hydroxybenzoicus DSM 7310]